MSYRVLQYTGDAAKVLAFLPMSPPDSILTAVTASTAISAKNELSGPRILELIAVLAAFTRFGLVRGAHACIVFNI